MSDVTADSQAHKESLRRVRRIGCAVLGLQLAGFLAWSTIQYSRFALTSDFATYNQAWFLIAHGHLVPYDTVQRFQFWRNHGELLCYPLALLYWVWPHGLTLLWLQDLCVTGAEAVAFTWVCELAGRLRQGREAAWLAGAGLVLLVANPWLWWAVSFDFHMEPFATLIAVLLARDLWNGRRRAWVWLVPLLACGDVADTYLAGVGLGGVLLSRRTRVPGAVMACLGVGATLLIALVHANLGSARGLQAYSYLAAGPQDTQLSLGALAKGIASHPLGVLRVVWAKRLELWANLAPSGLAGLGDPLILPLMLVVLLANVLFEGLLFAEPIFQDLPVYVLLPVGTVVVLGWLMHRRRRAALLLTGLLAAQALGWAVVWAPQAPSQWLRVSAPTAATLARIEAAIPASAEVIASQGVVGEFAERADVEPLRTPGTIPVRGGETWLVIAPAQGIEIQSTASAVALIGELAGPLHATLVTHAHGVWAFRWRPPQGVHSLSVPGELAPLPAWAAPMAPGAVGRSVMTGPPGTWRVTSSGGRGYVADEIAWQKPPGRYQALVTLSAAGPVNVEVWNDTGNVLLARRSIPATNGVESVVVPVDATIADRAGAYSGWGPFRADFIPPPEGERLEVRVWSPGAGTVNVYSADLIGGAVSRAFGPHRKLADEQPAGCGGGLGHGDVIGSGLPRAGGSDLGGERRAEGPVALHAQRDIEAGVIAGYLALPQAGRGGLRYRRGKVFPPDPLALLGAADHTEIRGQRCGLGLERCVSLAPRRRGRAGQAESPERHLVLLQPEALRGERPGRWHGQRHRAGSRRRQQGGRRGHGKGCVDEVPGIRRIQRIKRIAGIENHARDGCVVDRVSGRDDTVRRDPVRIGAARGDVTDLVPGHEPLDAGKPGHVMGGEDARTRMPRPGASRNVAYGVVQHGITGTFPDGGHQSQRRGLKQAARGGAAGCGCIADRAQAGRPVRCGCGDRPARTMDEAGAVDRGVVEEPSELRHDHGPSDDARDAGRDNHEVCPRTAPDLQPAPQYPDSGPMR